MNDRRAVDPILQAMRSEQKRQGELLDKFDETIHGNGQPGLKAQTYANTKNIKLIFSILIPVVLFLMGCAGWKAISG